MKRLKLTLSATALLAAATYIALPRGMAQSAAGAIQVTAKKYKFSPAVIKVKNGDHVKLAVTATDREHGIKIAAFHIDQKLPKDEPVTVEFTADRVGTFPFECSKFCGMGHGKMKGEIVVE
jgi:cytochrome c oxidase subunit 2